MVVVLYAEAVFHNSGSIEIDLENKFPQKVFKFRRKTLVFRGYFRLKRMTYFFQRFLYQYNCKDAMNMGEVKLEVPFLTFL